MKFRVTDAHNFIRVFQLPNKYSSDYCFEGGHLVEIRLVDWFNPFESSDFWDEKVKEFDSTDGWYQENVQKLRDFIKEKIYFDSKYTFLAFMYSFSIALRASRFSTVFLTGSPTAG